MSYVAIENNVYNDCLMVWENTYDTQLTLK